MFVNHLIQVIDDFKELISSEIDQIFKFSEVEGEDPENIATNRKN